MANWKNYKQPNLGMLFYKQIFFESKILENIKKGSSDKVLKIKEVEEKGKTPFDEFYDALYHSAIEQTVPSQFPENCEDYKTVSLYTTYPGLTMGTGYDRETKTKGDFKIGFFFDHTTGQPIIPGSSVKGLMRSLFELDVDKKGNELTGEKSVAALQFILKEAIKNCDDENLKGKLTDITGKLNTSNLNEVKKAIFGGQDQIGADIFFDAVINFDEWQNKPFLSNDFITPHQPNILKNPTPLMFLKVLPNVPFQFRFKLSNKGWKADVKQAIFKTILLTIGAGAKTNVGYGQFSETKIKIDQITNRVFNKKKEKPPVTDLKEKHKDKFVPKEGLEPKKSVYGIVTEIRGNNLVFEPLISDYKPEKLPSVQAGNLVKDVSINHLIEVKVSKVKPDGTLTFKDAKKVNLKPSKK